MFALNAPSGPAVALHIIVAILAAEPSHARPSHHLLAHAFAILLAQLRRIARGSLPVGSKALDTKKDRPKRQDMAKATTRSS